jgi:hypothetical protein
LFIINVGHLRIALRRVNVNSLALPVKISIEIQVGARTDALVPVNTRVAEHSTWCMLTGLGG